MLIAFENDAVIYNLYLAALPREVLLYEGPQAGILAVGHNENLADEGRKTKDGSNAVLDLSDALVARSACNIVIAGGNARHIPAALGLEHGIVTVYPWKQRIYLEISHFKQYFGTCQEYGL